MNLARRVWHWIDGPLPRPQLEDRAVGETDAEYERRRQTFLAESSEYQAQNMHLAARNIRAAAVLMVLAGIISAATKVLKALH